MDRLGIPLVEITTEPDIKTPQQAYEVAKEIGMILRSTKKVKRGIGTIRQDVNVSIEGGSRVEIKGVQNLELIPKLINMEVKRQLNLLKLKNIFLEKKVTINEKIINCTSLFKETKSEKILECINNNGVILCIFIKNGSNLFNYELQHERTFGTELEEKSKILGLFGMFHTDELPNYGITTAEINNLRKNLNITTKDCIIITTGIIEKATTALKDIILRIKQVFNGVPNETRRALKNGSTSYLRQLPGPSRMYPETDLRQIVINIDTLNNLKIPELITNKIKRYCSIYNLSKELSEKISYSIYNDTFEKLILNIGTNWNNKIITPTILANMFINIFQELKRENINLKVIDIDFLTELFSEINQKKLSKEIIKNVLLLKCNTNSLTIFDIKEHFSIIKNKDYEFLMRKDIELLIEDKKEFISTKKEYSTSPLMGLIMKKYRGKIDGKIINQILEEKIKLFLNSEC